MEKDDNNKNRRSGFDAPMIGQKVPKGTKFVELEDGKFEIIYPEEDENKKNKED
ncbi:MAG: hypothetical protein IJS61_02590 [Firmicutes bacterium]|nr:hypothetical protein [Bacillota bacterium]